MLLLFSLYFVPDLNFLVPFLILRTVGFFYQLWICTRKHSRKKGSLLLTWVYLALTRLPGSAGTVPSWPSHGRTKPGHLC